MSDLQRQRGSGQTWSFPLWCDICGRGHLGQCRAGSDTCYICGRPRHIMQDCPSRDSGSMAEPTSSTVGSSMFVRPSGHDSQSSSSRGRGRGRGSNSGGVEGAAKGFAGERFHQTQHLTLGCTGTVCAEEIWISKDVY
uniref:CCHC-type domain-containing protein n=1 Tax=Nicotiana tabacum TaxID=4097 RepID=A0A1S3ZQ61_TOBAC|nr:PREDICTED: uncharacterized protein LOC107789257 [Nicotiana tabacum]